MFSACASIGPPEPPSLDLPKPPTDLRATRKGNQVTLTWTTPTETTDRQRIRGIGATRICRVLNSVVGTCDTPVGRSPAQKEPTKSAGKSEPQSYVDSLSPQLQSGSPSDFVDYAVEVLNREGRGAGFSNQVRVPLVRTSPAPNNFQAQVTAVGITLSWSLELPSWESSSSLHLAVRIYRKQEGGARANVVAELPAEGDHSFTDSNFVWEKTYDYWATVVTIVDEPNRPALKIEGDDTPEVKVFADDVFPPSVPTGLQAVFSGPGQSPFVDLIWAPATDADLAGYNLYRQEGNSPPIKLNSDLVKNPAYRDNTVEPGKTYVYSVSAVDQRGNESARSEEAKESAPQ